MPTSATWIGTGPEDEEDAAGRGVEKEAPPSFDIARYCSISSQNTYTVPLLSVRIVQPLRPLVVVPAGRAGFSPVGGDHFWPP